MMPGANQFRVYAIFLSSIKNTYISEYIEYYNPQAQFLPVRKNNKTKMNSANAVETVSFLHTISGYTSF